MSKNVKKNIARSNKNAIRKNVPYFPGWAKRKYGTIQYFHFLIPPL